MLGEFYRFTMENDCGQNISAGGVTINANRWKFDSSGNLVFEGAATEVMSVTGTIADGGYESSSAIDNSSNKYIGGDFTARVSGVASANGNVHIYYETSVDNSVWPGVSGNAANVGHLVASVSVITNTGLHTDQPFSI